MVLPLLLSLSNSSSAAAVAFKRLPTLWEQHLAPSSQPSFSLLERSTVESGNSHLVTSTGTPFLLQPRCVSVLDLL